jgi:hypothetical protein
VGPAKWDLLSGICVVGPSPLGVPAPFQLKSVRAAPTCPALALRPPARYPPRHGHPLSRLPPHARRYAGRAAQMAQELVFGGGRRCCVGGHVAHTCVGGWWKTLSTQAGYLSRLSDSVASGTSSSRRAATSCTESSQRISSNSRRQRSAGPRRADKQTKKRTTDPHGNARPIQRRATRQHAPSLCRVQVGSIVEDGMLMPGAQRACKRPANSLQSVCKRPCEHPAKRDRCRRSNHHEDSWPSNRLNIPSHP